MRLTEVDDNGNWRLEGVEWRKMTPGTVISAGVWEKLCGAFWKLKNYEDTDLTPEQVSELQDETQEQARKMLERVAKLSDEIDRMKEEKGQRWIPVTERLPEPDSFVLVTLGGTLIPDIAEYGGTWQECIRFRPADDAYDEYGREVIAWMPLPEPYKENE